LDVDGTLDSNIRLFDANGNELAFSEDNAAPGESASTQSYLEYTFPNTGRFYLGVSGFGNRSYNPSSGFGATRGLTGDYTLTIQRVNDPDDQIGEEARSITVGTTSEPGTIDPQTDVDMYEFDAVLGQRLGCNRTSANSQMVRAGR
jgi:hypothetical protein